MALKFSNIITSGKVKIFGAASQPEEEPIEVSRDGSVATTQNTSYVGNLPSYFTSAGGRDPLLGTSLISDDGAFVHWDGRASPIIGTNIADMSQKWIIDAQKVMADLDARGFPISTLDETLWGISPMVGGLLPDRKHVFACVTSDYEGSSPNNYGGVYILLYDISSGTPVAQYGSHHRFPYPPNYYRPDQPYLISIAEDQTADKQIILWHYHDGRLHGTRLPSINEYRSDHLAETWIDSWVERTFILEQDTDSPVLGAHRSLMPTTYSSEITTGIRGFMLPYSSPYYTRLWWMINKSDMLYHANADNTGRNTDLIDLTSTYPDGVLLSDTIMFTPEEDLSWWQIFLMIISAGFYNPYSENAGEYQRDLDAMNHRVVDINGIRVFPFDDAFYDYLGDYNTVGEHDYLWRPTIRKISSNFYLVIFAKKFERGASGPSGVRGSIRVCIFDMSKQQFVQYTEETYVPFDIVDDLGVAERYRYWGDTVLLAVDYHPATGKYYEIRYNETHRSDTGKYHDWTLTEVGTMTFAAPSEIGISSQLTGMSLVGETPVVITGNVQFVTATDTEFVTASSLSQTIPVEVLPGDMVVAAIMHRSALTLPTGWTSIESASVTDGSFSQWTTLVQRIAQEGDAGTTQDWVQATSARMAVHYVVLRGPSLFVGQSAVGSGKTEDMPIPELTATSFRQMAITVMSNLYGASSGETTINAPTGWTQTTPVTVVDNRLGTAYKDVMDGETTTGSFSSGLTTNAWASVTIIVDTA